MIESQKDTKKLKVCHSRFSLTYTLIALVIAGIALAVFISGASAKEQLKDILTDQAHSISTEVFDTAQESLENSTIKIAESIEESVIKKSSQSDEFDSEDIETLERIFEETQEELIDQINNQTPEELNKSQIEQLVSPVLDGFLFNGSFGPIVIFLFVFSVLMILKLPLYILLLGIVWLINLSRKEKTAKDSK